MPCWWARANTYYRNTCSCWHIHDFYIWLFIVVSSYLFHSFHLFIYVRCFLAIRFWLSVKNKENINLFEEDLEISRCIFNFLVRCCYARCLSACAPMVPLPSLEVLFLYKRTPFLEVEVADASFSRRRFLRIVFNVHRILRNRWHQKAMWLGLKLCNNPAFPIQKLVNS